MADIKLKNWNGTEQTYSDVSKIIVPSGSSTAEFIQPSGSIDISANGTFDVGAYASALVNVTSNIYIAERTLASDNGASVNYYYKTWPFSLSAEAAAHYTDSSFTAILLPVSLTNKNYELQAMMVTNRSFRNNSNYIYGFFSIYGYSMDTVNLSFSDYSYNSKGMCCNGAEYRQVGIGVYDKCRTYKGATYRLICFW